MSQEPLSFTALVTPLPPAFGTPAGTVAFSDGTIVLCAAIPLAAGEAEDGPGAASRSGSGS